MHPTSRTSFLPAALLALLALASARPAQAVDLGATCLFDLDCTYTCNNRFKAAPECVQNVCSCTPLTGANAFLADGMTASKDTAHADAVALANLVDSKFDLLATAQSCSSQASVDNGFKNVTQGLQSLQPLTREDLQDSLERYFRGDNDGRRNENQARDQDKEARDQARASQLKTGLDQVAGSLAAADAKTARLAQIVAGQASKLDLDNYFREADARRQDEANRLHQDSDDRADAKEHDHDARDEDRDHRNGIDNDDRNERLEQTLLSSHRKFENEVMGSFDDLRDAAAEIPHRVGELLEVQGTQEKAAFSDVKRSLADVKSSVENNRAAEDGEKLLQYMGRAAGISAESYYAANDPALAGLAAERSLDVTGGAIAAAWQDPAFAGAQDFVSARAACFQSTNDAFNQGLVTADSALQALKGINDDFATFKKLDSFAQAGLFKVNGFVLAQVPAGQVQYQCQSQAKVLSGMAKSATELITAALMRTEGGTAGSGGQGRGCTPIDSANGQELFWSAELAGYAEVVSTVAGSQGVPAPAGGGVKKAAMSLVSAVRTSLQDVSLGYSFNKGGECQQPLKSAGWYEKVAGQLYESMAASDQKAFAASIASDLRSRSDSLQTSVDRVDNTSSKVLDILNRWDASGSPTNDPFKFSDGREAIFKAAGVQASNYLYQQDPGAFQQGAMLALDESGRSLELLAASKAVPEDFLKSEQACLRSFAGAFKEKLDPRPLVEGLRAFNDNLKQASQYLNAYEFYGYVLGPDNLYYEKVQFASLVPVYQEASFSSSLKAKMSMSEGGSGGGGGGGGSPVGYKTYWGADAYYAGAGPDSSNWNAYYTLARSLNPSTVECPTLLTMARLSEIRDAIRYQMIANDQRALLVAAGTSILGKLANLQAGADAAIEGTQLAKRTLEAVAGLADQVNLNTSYASRAADTFESQATLMNLSKAGFKPAEFVGALPAEADALVNSANIATKVLQQGWDVYGKQIEQYKQDPIYFQESQKCFNELQERLKKAMDEKNFSMVSQIGSQLGRINQGLAAVYSPTADRYAPLGLVEIQASYWGPAKVGEVAAVAVAGSGERAAGADVALKNPYGASPQPDGYASYLTDGKTIAIYVPRRVEVWVQRNPSSYVPDFAGCSADVPVGDDLQAIREAIVVGMFDLQAIAGLATIRDNLVGQFANVVDQFATVNGQLQADWAAWGDIAGFQGTVLKGVNDSVTLISQDTSTLVTASTQIGSDAKSAAASAEAAASRARDAVSLLTVFGSDFKDWVKVVSDRFDSVSKSFEALNGDLKNYVAGIGTKVDGGFAKARRVQAWNNYLQGSSGMLRSNLDANGIGELRGIVDDEAPTEQTQPMIDTVAFINSNIDVALGQGTTAGLVTAARLLKQLHSFYAAAEPVPDVDTEAAALPEGQRGPWRDCRAGGGTFGFCLHHAWDLQ